MSSFSFKDIVSFVMWSAVFICATLAGLYDIDSNAGRSLLQLAMITLVIGHVAIYFRKNHMYALLRSATSTSRFELSPILGDLSPGPVTSSAVDLHGIQAGLYPASATYDVVSKRISSSTEFRLDYLVMAIDLGKKVPHVFVDGVSQNRYNNAHPNLWSLSRLLNKSDKIQELEGDFSKYFQVYAADKGSMPLTILAPDVMYELRQKGQYFDYELHRRWLYIYREQQFESKQEIEDYLSATAKIAKEICDQVRKQNFAISGRELELRPTNLRFWASWYTLVIASKYFAYLFFTVAYAAILTEALYGAS